MINNKDDSDSNSAPCTILSCTALSRATRQAEKLRLQLKDRRVCGVASQ